MARKLPSLIGGAVGGGLVLLSLALRRESEETQADVGLVPTADFDWSPVNPAIGEAVTFDASDSSSAGTIASYEWSIDGQTMTGVQVSHTFPENVREAVTLTITDGQGNTDTITQTLLVGGCPVS